MASNKTYNMIQEGTIRDFLLSLNNNAKLGWNPIYETLHNNEGIFDILIEKKDEKKMKYYIAHEMNRKELTIIVNKMVLEGWKPLWKTLIMNSSCFNVVLEMEIEQNENFNLMKGGESKNV